MAVVQLTPDEVEDTYSKWSADVERAEVTQVIEAANWHAIMRYKYIYPYLSYGWTVEGMAALHGVTSANRNLATNLTIVDKVVRGTYRGKDRTGLERIRWTGLQSKGLGRKTLPYARNLMGDLDPVVIDLWMMRSVVWHTSVPRERPTLGQVAQLTEIVQQIGFETGLDNAVVQALLWIIARGSSGLEGEGQ